MIRSRSLLYYTAVVGLSALLLAAACAPEAPASIVEVGNQPVQPANQSQGVIYVTPTPRPSPIPTLRLFTPSDTPPPLPTATHTPDAQQLNAACQATLNELYRTAGELCLGEADGYFCNGGSAPDAGPAERIRGAMSVPGSLVPADQVQMVHTPPLLAGRRGGGLMWLHLQEEEVQKNALLLGDVRLQDITPRDQGFPPWRSINVITRPGQHADCPQMPHSAFVVQSPYGRQSRLVINGVSVDLNGTMAVQTDADEQQTAFILLEGSGRVIVRGQARSLYAGQQIDIPAADDNFRTPAGVPDQARPLEWERIAGLPAEIFDRPVLLPQPGYVLTRGNINMRAEPDESAQLLYQVPPDEVLSVLGYNGERDWYHIRLGNGETGWMRADLLDAFTGPIEVAYDLTPQPPQRLGDLGTRARVIAGQGGNLRSAPDVSFPIMALIPEGTEIELLARSPYSPWVKVDANGQVGWIALIAIDTQSAIGFLPVDYDVPLPPRPTATPIWSFGGGHAYPDPRGGS